MRRTLPLLLAAVCAGYSGAAQGQAMPEPAMAQPAMGWQDQRYIALQRPGHTVSILRQLARDHDAGRGETGAEVRVHGVTVRDGRAFLFHARSDDFPLARFGGAVDGQGIHLIMSWPP
jgi:hypothetical protein